MLNAALTADHRFAGTSSLMSPKRWNRVRAVMEAAFEAPREERDSVLVNACAGEPTLLSQARSIVRMAEDTNGFLLRPVSDTAFLESHDLDVNGTPVPDGEFPDATIGPFALIRRLGAGGMGEVFLAEDSRLRRKVALKFVRPEMARDSERVWRFEREALAAAALNHPNVCTVYEVGGADDRRYIAMEYVEGLSLAAHIKKRSLGLREVIAIAIEVADALQEAHSKGIVHRDVKPSNVMVTLRGHAKVLDFGVAKFLSDFDPPGRASVPLSPETASSGCLGSADYMSPEQAQGVPVDPRSDIFCFGVTLYEMATGRLPFKRAARASMAKPGVDGQAVEPVSHHDPALPGQLDRLVSRCLERDRERRYPTAHDLLTDLRSVQQGLEERPQAGAFVGSG